MQKFRFHTGSIKRGKSLQMPRVSNRSFDSILVRLKGSAKATVILYPVLVGRVKSIIILRVFKIHLPSTSDYANSLGVRRIPVGRGVNDSFS